MLCSTHASVNSRRTRVVNLFKCMCNRPVVLGVGSVTAVLGVGSVTVVLLVLGVNTVTNELGDILDVSSSVIAVVETMH